MALSTATSTYQPRSARQPQPGHSRLNHITCIPTASEVTASLAQCASDVCIPTATSEAAAAMTHPPVSAIAIYQQRPATINSDQCSNSNYDSRVSNSCISTATSLTAAANLTSVSAIAIITVYQQRSAKQIHLWHSHASDACVPTTTSEASATMTQPRQQ